MSKFRGKFQLVSITQYASHTEHVDVTFEPKYSIKDSAEDNSYSKYTPNATLKLTITNPTVIENLKIGKFYYVDFTEIE